jgi:lysozyme
MKWVGTILTILVFASLVIAGIAYLTGFWKPALRSASVYPVRGVDISNHQGAVNWPLVASGKIAFAYLKATEGGDFKDQRFAENWKKAAASGVLRGAYHFFRFGTPGRTQAENFIAAVPRDPSALPPAVDLEFWGNAKSRPGVAEFRVELDDLLKRLRNRYGKEPVIYTSSEFYHPYLKGYPLKRLWIRDTLAAPRLSDACPWLIWQFTDKGRVRGIRGNVDLDAFSGDSRSLKDLAAEKRGP